MRLKKQLRKYAEQNGMEKAIIAVANYIRHQYRPLRENVREIREEVRGAVSFSRRIVESMQCFAINFLEFRITDFHIRKNTLYL